MREQISTDPASRESAENSAFTRKMIGVISLALAPVLAESVMALMPAPEGQSAQIPLRPQKPFRLLNVDGNKFTMEQDGNTYVLEDQKILDAVITRITQRRPDLKSFFEAGNFKIVNPE